MSKTRGLVRRGFVRFSVHLFVVKRWGRVREVVGASRAAGAIQKQMKAAPLGSHPSRSSLIGPETDVHVGGVVVFLQFSIWMSWWFFFVWLTDLEHLDTDMEWNNVHETFALKHHLLRWTDRDLTVTWLRQSNNALLLQSVAHGGCCSCSA